MDCKIDFDMLRNDLIDYFGTGMAAGISTCTYGIIEVENASDEELLRIANREGLNLQRYFL